MACCLLGAEASIISVMTYPGTQGLNFGKISIRMKIFSSQKIDTFILSPLHQVVCLTPVLFDWELILCVRLCVDCWVCVLKPVMMLSTSEVDCTQRVHEWCTCPGHGPSEWADVAAVWLACWVALVLIAEFVFIVDPRRGRLIHSGVIRSLEGTVSYTAHVSCLLWQLHSAFCLRVMGSVAGFILADFCLGWGSDLILGLRPANERRCYKVTPSLIGWAQI